MKFEAELKQHKKYPNAAFVTFPFDIEETFGKKRVKVKAKFDGQLYRGSISKMLGMYMLVVPKAIREAIDKTHGDIVWVEIEEDTEERIVEISEEFKTALEKAGLLDAFEQMSYSNRKEYARSITEAKREATKQRRIEKNLKLIGDWAMKKNLLG